MFNPAIYENSRPDGIPVLEIAPETEPKEDQPRLFVPLKRSELRGEVIGPLAALRLIQTFGYTRAQLDKVIEAVYRFPLPGDAAVTSVVVRFGDVEIVAELKEREQAEAEYQEAKKQGQQAALATRESSSVFTLRVAGIRPDEDVMVETRYVQLARPEGQGWSLRIPLTTAPRYVRDDEATARPAQGQPLFLLRDPGHRFALDVLVRGVAEVTSPTHALNVEVDSGQGAPGFHQASDTPATADALRVRLHDGEVIPDRDCVLAWKPRQEFDRPALEVFTHDDLSAGWTYFLALVAPPASVWKSQAVPREVTLLVDHSGSMAGPKWEAADWGVLRFLNDLTDQDALALGLFHTTTRWLATEMRPANAVNVKEASDFVQAHKDAGGTNLGVALEQGLNIAPLSGEHARHLLLVTDAQVSDEGRIRRLADEEAARSKRRRISVLCIDAAPNSFLANEIAERGGGVARFLTSSPEEEDITTALDEVLADWAAPVYANLKLNVNRPAVQAAGRALLKEQRGGWQSIDLGDLPAGRAVWVAGRVSHEAGDGPSFELIAGNKRLAQCDPGAPGLSPAAAADQPALKALFGARRVLALEYLINSGYTGEDLESQLKRLGYSTSDLSKQTDQKRVYAENAREDVQRALKGLLVREALDYGLACSETAFVAVRKEKGEVVAGTVPVANALPGGWSEGFLAAPPPGVLAFGAAPSAPMGVARMMQMSSAPDTSIDGGSLSMPAFLRRGRGNSSSSAKVKHAATAQPEAEPVRAAGLTQVYSGSPELRGGEAVLFDSARARDAKRFPAGVTIRQIAVELSVPDAAALNPNLALLIFVGDLAAPRARVSLRDVLRQGGRRPMNLRSRPGDVVRIVLIDPDGVWTGGAPVLGLSVQA